MSDAPTLTPEEAYANAIARGSIEPVELLAPSLRLFEVPPNCPMRINGIAQQTMWLRSLALDADVEIESFMCAGIPLDAATLTRDGGRLVVHADRSSEVEPVPGAYNLGRVLLGIGAAWSFDVKPSPVARQITVQIYADAITQQAVEDARRRLLDAALHAPSSPCPHCGR